MNNDDREGDAESSNGNNSPTDTNIHEQRSTRISTDTIHDLLSNGRRRHLLSYLVNRPDETVPIDGVIDRIMRDERPDLGPVPHRERVEVDLHHVHLPKLADAGVIEHDPVAETVRYDGPEALATLLAVTDEVEAQEE